MRPAWLSLYTWLHCVSKFREISTPNPAQMDKYLLIKLAILLSILSVIASDVFFYIAVIKCDLLGIINALITKHPYMTAYIISALA